MRLKGQHSTEFRFELIVKLSKEHKSQSEIAQLVNCSQAWVSKVLKRYKQEGESGLKIKGFSEGKSPKLTAIQLTTLERMLLEGGLVYGFETDNWTRERIASLINTHFKVTYHPSHISKIMRRIGFTLQKPKTKSYRKDAQAVADWKTSRLAELKKKRSKKEV
jgi:transposase